MSSRFIGQNPGNLAKFWYTTEPVLLFRRWYVVTIEQAYILHRLATIRNWLLEDTWPSRGMRLSATLERFRYEDVPMDSYRFFVDSTNPLIVEFTLIASKFVHE
jgi:hypothetical protein